MATQQQQQQQQQPATSEAQAKKPDAELLDRILDQAVTYKPFMSNDEVTLSPRMVIHYLTRRTKSGKTCTPEQAVRFLRLCQARALNPWEGDAYVVGFDTKDGPEFNLVTAHQAFLKRAEVHPEYDGMESGVTAKLPSGEIVDIEGDFFDEGQALVGGWARVHFKTRKIPTYRRLKLATFHKGVSRWNVDPAGMIVKCAEADALRSSFPTKLGGMYLREEFDAMVSAAPTAREPVPMPKALPQETDGNGASHARDETTGAAQVEEPPDMDDAESARTDRIDILRDRIKEADSQDTHVAVAREIEEAKDFIGPEAHADLLHRWQLRGQQLRPRAQSARR